MTAWRWLLIACVCLCPGALAATLPAVIELHQPQPHFIATRQGYFLANTELDPRLQIPEPSQRIELSRLSRDTTRFWIHIPLLNRTNDTEWVLDLNNAVVIHLLVHSINRSHHRISEQGYVPRWPFDLRYGAALTLPTNEITELWIYVENPYGATQPLFSVLPQTLYQQQASRYAMQLLITLSAVMVLVVALVVALVISRKQIYGWAALAHLMAAIAWAAQGKILLYSLNLSAHWYAFYLPLFLALASLIQYARHYLHLHYPHPLAYVLNGATALVLACGATGVLLPAHHYVWLLALITPPVLSLLAVAGLWHWRERFIGVRGYLAAIGLLLAACVGRLLNDSLQLNLLENPILAAVLLQLVSLVLLLPGLLSRTSPARQTHQTAPEPTTDPVTGLPNRVAFERDVRAWEAYCREGIFGDFYLSFFEIANLAEVNRRKGRKEGDRLLRLVGQWLQQQTGTKNVYRTGGDELLALCQKAIRWDLSALREHLHQEGFRQVQVNIGSSCFSESNGRSSLLKLADDRLHLQALR